MDVVWLPSGGLLEHELITAKDGQACWLMQRLGHIMFFMKASTANMRAALSYVTHCPCYILDLSSDAPSSSKQA